MMKVYSVSEITSILQQTLQFNPILQGAWVEGEVTNLRIHPSGHIYFTLTDIHSSIQAVFFDGVSRCNGNIPKTGTLIQAFGRVDIFPKRGVYQLYVEQITQPLKTGSLQEKFLQIKEKLEKDGILARARKKIPLFPRRIGIITSRESSVLRDILRVGWGRWPGAHFLLVSATVQGEETPASIIRALRWLNAYGKVDIILIARGGGSLEDLWGFNDETLARSIASSSLPVITGIGHEVDTTIADLVADAVAPTPSGAAERAVPDSKSWLHQLNSSYSRLLRQLRHRITSAQKNLQYLTASPSFLYPLRKIQHLAQQLDDAYSRLNNSFHRFLKEKEETLKHLHLLLSSLSPYGVLERGYAIVMKPEGTLVRSIDEVSVGNALNIVLKDGVLTAEILQKEGRKNESRNVL